MHSILLEKCPTNGQVGAPLKKMSRKEDFLFCVHFVGNFTLLLCTQRHSSLLKCVLHVQHAYFLSFNQSYHCFGVSLPLSSSLLELLGILGSRGKEVAMK